MRIRELTIALLIMLFLANAAYAFNDRFYAETQFELKVEGRNHLLVIRQIIEWALRPHQSIWVVTEGEKPAYAPLRFEDVRFGYHIGFEHRTENGSLIIGRHFSTDEELTYYLQWAAPW